VTRKTDQEAQKIIYWVTPDHKVHKGTIVQHRTIEEDSQGKKTVKIRPLTRDDLDGEFKVGDTFKNPKELSDAEFDAIAKEYEKEHADALIVHGLNTAAPGPLRTCTAPF
jgi:hypothetical protein